MSTTSSFYRFHTMLASRLALSEGGEERKARRRRSRRRGRRDGFPLMGGERTRKGWRLCWELPEKIQSDMRDRYTQAASGRGKRKREHRDASTRVNVACASDVHRLPLTPTSSLDPSKQLARTSLTMKSFSGRCFRASNRLRGRRPARLPSLEQSPPDNQHLALLTPP